MKKFLIVFFLITVFYVYLHYFISSFVSRFIYKRSFWDKFFVFLCLLSVSTLFLRRFLTGGLWEYLYIASFIWMGYVIIFSSLILVSKIILLVYPFDFKKIFIATFALSVLILFKSVYNTFKLPLIKEVEIHSPYISRNYKFVFLSDIHLDFKFKNKVFSKIVDKIKSQNPDFILIGGDLLDPGFNIDKDVLKLKSLGFAVFGVLGNHEYYYGIERSIRIFEELNIKLIRNSSINFDGLNIIGFGDIKAEQLEEKDILNIVSKNYMKNHLNVIVSHQPLYFEEISNEYDIIMISGHTHKGQIFPFHIFTKIAYKYFYGEYKNKNSLLYISSGAGTWGPPMRFLAESEIVIFNIKKM